MSGNDKKLELRELLGVAEDAATEDILALIKNEGWEPDLRSNEVEGQTLWACPVRRGIFQTSQVNPKTGQTGQAGSPTPEIAALGGLARARFNFPLLELWGIVNSGNVSGDEVQAAAVQLSSADGQIPFYIKGCDDESRSPSFVTQVFRLIEGWKPTTVEQRQKYLSLALAFLTFLAVRSTCRSEQSTTVINNFWNSDITWIDKG